LFHSANSCNLVELNNLRTIVWK